jgi:hypothetical protein
MTALTMREPRKAKPKVELEAGASPNQESLEQYCGVNGVSRVSGEQEV